MQKKGKDNQKSIVIQAEDASTRSDAGTIFTPLYLLWPPSTDHPTR
jgi:hypothetical protein